MKSASFQVVNDHQTFWVRLSGVDLDRALFMRATERRSFAALLRAALTYYYEGHYGDRTVDAESA